MIDPIILTCARAIIEVYKMPLVANPPLPDLSSLGLKSEKVIMGNAGAGLVPFGVISSSISQPNSPLLVAFRGTDFVISEWLDDFKAILVSNNIVPGSKYEKGFGEIYETLVVDGVKLSEYLQFKEVYCCGHSLGGPLATMTSVESVCSVLVIFASPRPADSTFAAYARKVVKTIYSYGNKFDLIWRAPLTIDIGPFKLEDFEPIVEPTILDPFSVTPNISIDAASSHSMANYLLLLLAIP